MLTAPEFSEMVNAQSIDDATKRINTATLKNQYPIGSSVSAVTAIFSTVELPQTTYWRLTRGEEDDALSESITVKIDLYVY